MFPASYFCEAGHQSVKLSDHMKVQFLTRWPPPRHIFVNLVVDKVGGFYS